MHSSRENFQFVAFSAPKPKRSFTRSFVPESCAVGSGVLRRFHALFAIKAAYFAKRKKINLRCRLLSPHGTPPRRRARARWCALEYICRSYRPPWRHKGQRMATACLQGELWNEPLGRWKPVDVPGAVGGVEGTGEVTADVGSGGADGDVLQEEPRRSWGLWLDVHSCVLGPRRWRGERKRKEWNKTVVFKVGALRGLLKIGEKIRK